MHPIQFWWSKGGFTLASRQPMTLAWSHRSKIWLTPPNYPSPMILEYQFCTLPIVTVNTKDRAIREREYAVYDRPTAG